MALITKEYLIKTKVCPCCNGRLTVATVYGKGNLASSKVLKCKNCDSTF